MELNSEVLRGVLTVVLMGAFVGIWIWAWSSKRKSAFDAMSRLPLEEDEGVAPGDDESGSKSV